MWSQDPPYTVMVGVLTVDWTTLATTISPFSTNTHLRKDTREEVEILTHRTEGAWKHAKEHFRRMYGTKISQFEGNICEIMWRAEAKSHVYERFFGYLKNIYNLNGPPANNYPTPLFPTWSELDSNSQLEEWEIKPGKLPSSISIYDVFTFIIFPITL